MSARDSMNNAERKSHRPKFASALVDVARPEAGTQLSTISLLLLASQPRPTEAGNIYSGPRRYRIRAECRGYQCHQRKLWSSRLAGPSSSRQVMNIWDSIQMATADRLVFHIKIEKQSRTSICVPWECQIQKNERWLGCLQQISKSVIHISRRLNYPPFYEVQKKFGGRIP